MRIHKQTGLGMHMNLIDFIMMAKRSGYASGGEEQELKFDDGSIGFKFKSDGFTYVDRYRGFNPFSGSEYVYNADNALIWTMNYYGEVFSSCSDPMKIYSFLREAMSLISVQYPFRGPAKLERDNLQYQNQQNGTLQSFNGIESIYEDSEKVYCLYYHGGDMIQET